MLNKYIKITHLAILGQMGSGKSVLARKLIENINNISYSDRAISHTEVLFISKSNESADEMSVICKNKSFKFTWWKLVHNFNNIVKNENPSRHLIVVMEDLSGDINHADSKFNSEIISFLFRSRHHNISVINILHGIGHAMTKKNSFERIFLDNISGIFMFKPINNKKNNIQLFKKLFKQIIIYSFKRHI